MLFVSSNTIASAKIVQAKWNSKQKTKYLLSLSTTFGFAEGTFARERKIKLGFYFAFLSLIRTFGPQETPYQIISMEIINLSDNNSIINQYMAEIRDKDYQKNRLLYDLERIWRDGKRVDPKEFWDGCL